MTQPLDRRTLLRGAGAALALPWMEAMLPPLATAPKPPVRLVWMYVPNGMHIESWRAGGDGLPATLDSLQPWRGRVSVHRGLSQHHARANGDGPGDHARAAAAWMTGVQPLKDDGQVRLGVSADQLAARAMGEATPLPALVVGCQGSRLSGQCDSGYACAYSGHLSWIDEATPAAKHTLPDRIFDMLFRAGAAPGTEAQASGQRIRRRSVLDLVRSEARGLAGRLGTQDRQRLERYLTSVRELEQRIASAARLTRPDVEGEWRSEGVPAKFGEHAKQLADLIFLALRTDVTRVATFLVANEGSNRAYREIGAREGHHSLSHHQKDAAKLEQIQAIDRFHGGILQHFLERLSSHGEGEGDLLRSTLLLYGSGIADGNRHDHHDLPILLCGEGGGAVTQGVNRVWEDRTPLNDMHLAMLQAGGLRDVALGDGRGPLQLG